MYVAYTSRMDFPHGATGDVGMQGGGRGGGPHFAGGRGQGNMQKKKRPQRGLEDNIRRTVYISYVDCQVRELVSCPVLTAGGRVLASGARAERWLAHCGSTVVTGTAQAGRIISGASKPGSLHDSKGLGYAAP